jgi:hypothetical protein
MAAVKEKDFDPQLDHFKSDVFIFAVIILGIYLFIFGFRNY